MEQQNKKPMLPAFSATGFPSQFPGLPNNGANALMSTLQTLQMQSLGNTIIPTANITPAEFSQRMLLEQMKAVQDMYNKFTSVKSSEQNGVNQTPVNTFQTAVATNKYGNTIFPNTTGFLANDLQTIAAAASLKNLKDDSPASGSSSHPSSSTPQEIDVGTNALNASTSPSFLKSNLILDKATTSTAKDDDSWWNPIPSTSNDEPQNVEAPNTTISNIADTSSIEADTSKNSDMKEQQDDVMEMFGLSNLDDAVEQGEANEFAGGLSPVQFTPPDSPTDSLTIDNLFGWEPKETESNCSDKPSTSNDCLINIPTETNKSNDCLFKSPRPPMNDIRRSPKMSAPDQKMSIFNMNRQTVKSNKVPVYKQKVTTISTEIKKDDKSYDAFEFDEEEEEEIINTQEIKEKEPDPLLQCDSKSKSVYVPGIGFAVSNETQNQQDLWKHVVPKKRPVGEIRQAPPDTNLLPSSVQHETEATVSEPTMITFSDSLRVRRNQRFDCDFLSPLMSNDIECCGNIIRRQIQKDIEPLPIFCIRITKTIETVQITPVRRKKRRKYGCDDDDDGDDEDYYSDYEETTHTYRRRKGCKTMYELVVIDPKKEVGEKNDRIYTYDLDAKKPYVNNENLSVMHRLSKFGPAEGFLPKGTYVVCKADLLKDDCALWRVDNQNLLQKFPPNVDAATNRIIYKSSSTYSGWCEQISPQYYRVTVRVLQQNRSETTIEPEVPLAELFPAMSEELHVSPMALLVKKPLEACVDGYLTKDPLRISMHTFIVTILTHSLTLNYLQEQYKKNDWTFLRSLTEIEQFVDESEAKIMANNHAVERYLRLVQDYTRLIVSPTEYYEQMKCQICCSRVVSNVLQFFDKHSYDSLTLEDEQDDDSDSCENDDDDVDEIYDYSSLPAVDVLVCDNCSKAYEMLHQVRHIRLHILRICEEKLEIVGTELSELAPEKIVDIVKKDTQWISSVVRRYVDLANKINTLYP